MGHHYARPTNTRAQRGAQGWRRASGESVCSPCTDRCRRLRGAPRSLPATLPFGMRREKSRYHFEPFRSRKGVTLRGCNLKRRKKGRPITSRLYRNALTLILSYVYAAAQVSSFPPRFSRLSLSEKKKGRKGKGPRANIDVCRAEMRAGEILDVSSWPPSRLLPLPLDLPSQSAPHCGMFDGANAHRTGALPPCSFTRCRPRRALPPLCTCTRPPTARCRVFTYQSERGEMAPWAIGVVQG